jgi:hypothetical protein
MWCIVWMNYLKVKSKFRLTYRLLDRLILDYFSLHLDYGRGPLWCLKLYFIRPWFLEHQQIPSFAVGSLRKELLLKDFDCFWVIYRQFRNRITWLLIASLSSNLFLFDWSGRWRFIVHHEGWFILMRFYRSQWIGKVSDSFCLASPSHCYIIRCTVAMLFELMELMEPHEAIQTFLLWRFRRLLYLMPWRRSLILLYLRLLVPPFRK